MKVLIVHNSDEVKACFFGETGEELLGKVAKSKYIEDILERLNDRSHEDDVQLTATDIDIEQVTSLYHDGDSEDGYTLLEAI